MNIACHRVRMDLVRQVASSLSNPSLLRKAVYVHAKEGQVKDAIKLAQDDFFLKDLILKGVWEKQVFDKKPLGSYTTKFIESNLYTCDKFMLMKLCSLNNTIVVGPSIIAEFKSFATTDEHFIFLIGVLRKLKSEKDFVWDTFLKISKKDNVLINFMSTVCATNGWHNRVAKCLSGATSINEQTGAKFIRAFNHYPHGSAVVDQVWEIAALVNPVTPPPLVVDALIEFYSVNKQFEFVKELLFPNTRSFPCIFRNIDSGNIFAFFQIFKKYNQSHEDKSFVTRAVIDAAIVQENAGELAKVLEWMHLKNVDLDPVSRSKIWTLNNNRINQLVDMINKKNVEMLVDPFSQNTFK